MSDNYRDFMILAIFLIYERCKGEDSFWHPYFETVQLVSLPAEWSDEKIERLVDTDLKANIKFFKKELAREWEIL